MLQNLMLILLISLYTGRSDAQGFGCPANPTCVVNSTYRTFDGTCNNVNNPTWGSTLIRYRRFIPSQYGDGLNTLRGPPATNILPTPRRLTAALTNVAVTSTSNVLTLMSMIWGQFISHDVNFTPNFDNDIVCCRNGQFVNTTDVRCLAINVTGDSFFDSQFGFKCIDLTRSRPAAIPCASAGCPQTCPREQVNSRTAFIDASGVYGVTTAEARSLRTLSRGQMFIGTNPTQEINANSCPATASGCPFNFLPSFLNNGTVQFLVGDFRAEQNPSLTSLHHFFLRVHNDLALTLSTKYPNLSDELLFQESRRTVISLIQHITYNEYLPALLGQTNASTYDLLPASSGFFTGYDTTVDPSLRNSFSAAAFRVGHTQISDTLLLNNGGSLQLSRSFNNHDITLTSGTFPTNFIVGGSSQASEIVDHFLVQSITRTLYAAAPFTNGSDLFSRNIIRGRDHGLQSYNQFRQFCGLSTFTSFSQLNGVLRPQAVTVFSSLYTSVNDIDLYPAGIAELPVQDGVVGPTFTCLLGRQFHNLKYGDRYFYENSKQPTPYTQAQLDAIRQTSLGNLICDYTNTNTIQPWVMNIVQSGNELQNCANRVRFVDQFRNIW